MSRKPPIRIDQMLPSYVKRDAIGTHTALIQKLLRARGFSSEIFAEMWSPQTKKECQHFKHFTKRQKASEGITIYHFSVGSPLLNFLTQFDDFKVISYHNITPPEYFAEKKEFRSYWATLQGFKQIPLARTFSDDAWAMSEFNARELASHDFPSIKVMPVLRDYAYLSKLNDDSRIKKLLSDNRKTIIFVGRIEPHKGQHDLLFLIKAYEKVFGEKLRLILIGNTTSVQKQKLDDLASPQKLNLRLCANYRDSDAKDADIIFPGVISDEEMASFYRHADAFVCASEHEGFCVPLVEAMFFGLPIIAHKATAVPETCGSAGLLIDKTNFASFVEAVRHVLTTKDLQDRLKEASLRRAEDFTWPVLERKFDVCLETTLQTYQSV